MRPRIDLDELDSRIKAMHRPTPQQVVNLIMVMYRELKTSNYIHASALGLGTIQGGLYSKA